MLHKVASDSKIAVLSQQGKAAEEEASSARWRLSNKVQGLNFGTGSTLPQIANTRENLLTQLVQPGWDGLGT